MRRWKYLGCASLLLALGQIQQGWAAGGFSGGGGDVIILPGAGDDRVVLADPFIVGTEAPGVPGTPVKLSENIINELKRVSYVLINIGAVGSGKLSDHSVQTRLVDDLIVAADYFVVDQIPDMHECKQRFTYSNLPEGARVEQVACTVGRYTWLKADLFAQLNVREQASLLVHEAFRRLPLSPMRHLAIGKLSAGLSVSLDHLNRQLQGKRESLTTEEITRMNGMLEAARDLIFDLPGYWNAEGVFKKEYDFSAWAHGGGWVSLRAPVDPTAFVGIGSSVTNYSKLEARAELFLTNFCSMITPCWMSEGASVVDSTFLGTEQWTQAFLFAPVAKNEAAAARQGSYHRLMKEAKIVRSTIGIEFRGDKPWLHLLHGAKILDSRILGRKLRMESQSRIEKVEILELTDMMVRRGASLMNLKGAYLTKSDVSDDVGRMFSSFLGGFRVDQWEVPVGVQVDLADAVLCSNEMNYFRVWGNGHVDIRAASDLAAVCL